MNILTLNYEFPPLGGGGGPVCRDLATQLVALGHRVDVVTMSFKGLPKQEVVDGVRIFRTPAFRRKMATCSTPEMLSYVLGAARFVLRLTRRETYDIVHCHFAIPTGPLAVLVRRRRKLPFVLTCHGSDIPGYNQDRFTLAHRFTRRPLRFILSRAAAVTSPSQFLKGLIEQQLGDYGVRVIPNGIDISQFTPVEKKKIILMTGRLLPRKGFQHVLRALEGIETDFEVHIAGDGPMMDELRQIASRVKTKVVFHGWLRSNGDELLRLYAEAAIFCMPSAAESFGMVFVQAMCAGCAVLGSTAGAIPDVVQDGVTGLLVPPGDVEAIRKVLRTWMARPDEAEALGRRARQRVLDCYDWRGTARQFAELYEKVRSGAI